MYIFAGLRKKNGGSKSGEGERNSKNREKVLIELVEVLKVVSIKTKANSMVGYLLLVLDKSI